MVHGSPDRVDGARAASSHPPTHRGTHPIVAPSDFHAPQKFAAFYLSKWQPGAAPKPVDRDVHRIHAWIAAAYQDKRWFAEPAGGWTPGAAAAARAPAGTSSSTEVRGWADECKLCCLRSRVALQSCCCSCCWLLAGCTPSHSFTPRCLRHAPPQGHEPAVRPLSEVLGGEAPRLQVQGSPSGHLERSISAVSSSAG